MSVLDHETAQNRLTGSYALLMRVGLTKPTCRKQCRKARHIQILEVVAEGILLYIYHFVLLSSWHSGLLRVELPDHVLLVGTDLITAYLLQHGAGGLTYSLNHVPRGLIETALIYVSIKIVCGFKVFNCSLELVENDEALPDSFLALALHCSLLCIVLDWAAEQVYLLPGPQFLPLHSWFCPVEVARTT